MKTVLDDARMWTLDRIEYTDVLRLVLVEMFVLDQNVDRTDNNPTIAKMLTDSHPIETTSASRRFVVNFERPIAWQVVDESYTTWDEYEIRDDTSVIQALSRAKYLDYINQNHGWYQDVLGQAIHYRVWTADDVVDVISCHGPPVIREHR